MQKALATFIGCRQPVHVVVCSPLVFVQHEVRAVADEIIEPGDGPLRVWLRRGEQIVIAAMVFAGLVSLGGYWWLRAVNQNRLIEFDHAPPRTALFQVDINSAEWPEIVQLPGVGETTARRIVAEREQGGPYLSLEDIALRVHGVGPRLLEDMLPYVKPIDGDEVAIRSDADDTEL